jgi:hypothetical protein
MADYKNIKGFNIQYLDSDPPNPIEGQMWFNSTTQTLKGAEVGGAPAGTWASGGDFKCWSEIWHWIWNSKCSSNAFGGLSYSRQLIQNYIMVLLGQKQKNGTAPPISIKTFTTS